MHVKIIFFYSTVLVWPSNALTLYFSKLENVFMYVCSKFSKEFSEGNRGVFGVAGRQEAAGLATGGFVRPTVGRPVLSVTRLLPPASPQSPAQTRARERYQTCRGIYSMAWISH